MLYPVQTAVRRRIPVVPLPEESAPARFLEIGRVLARLFELSPAVLSLPAGGRVTLLYRDVSYLWQDVADSVGSLATALSADRPLAFYGTTEDRETAECTFSPAGPGEGLLQLRSVSGREGGRLQGLAVQLACGEEEAAALVRLCTGVPFLAPCAALSRSCGECLAGSPLLASTQGSRFAYLAWEPTPPAGFLQALTAGHKVLLWQEFLTGGLQSLEFDWLWEHYYTGRGLALLEWELALRMVLEEQGFQVERRESCFQLADRQGRERRFDFARGGPAEKLFLKLLFPVDGK